MFCRRVGYMVVISKKSVISKKKNAFLFAGTPSQVPANFPMISPRILSFEFKSGIKIQFYKRYIWSFPSPISINHVIWTSHSLFQSLQSFLNPNELGNLVNMCLSTFENKEHLTFQICKKSNPKNLTISGSTICRFLTWNMPHSFQHVTWIIQFKEFQICWVKAQSIRNVLHACWLEVLQAYKLVPRPSRNSPITDTPMTRSKSNQLWPQKFICLRR